MFRISATLLLGLLLSASAFAQQSAQLTAAATATPAATSACAYTFTSGGTATVKYLQFCVTVNGNITEFQSPQGAEHIRVGTIGDGYALCDFTANEVGYHDYAGFGDSDTGPG